MSGCCAVVSLAIHVISCRRLGHLRPKLLPTPERTAETRRPQTTKQFRANRLDDGQGQYPESRVSERYAMRRAPSRAPWHGGLVFVKRAMHSDNSERCIVKRILNRTSAAIARAHNVPSHSRRAVKMHTVSCFACTVKGQRDIA